MCVEPRKDYPGLSFSSANTRTDANSCPEYMVPTNHTERRVFKNCGVAACTNWLHSDEEVLAFRRLALALGVLVLLSLGLMIPFLLIKDNFKTHSTINAFPMLWSVSSIFAVLGLSILPFAWKDKIACDPDGTRSTNNPENGNGYCTAVYLFSIMGFHASYLWYAVMTIYLAKTFRSMVVNPYESASLQVGRFLKYAHCVVWPLVVIYSFVPVFVSQLEGAPEPSLVACVPSPWVWDGALYIIIRLIPSFVLPCIGTCCSGISIYYLRKIMADSNHPRRRIVALSRNVRILMWMVTVLAWPPVAAELNFFLNKDKQSEAAARFFACIVMKQAQPDLVCVPDEDLRRTVLWQNYVLLFCSHMAPIVGAGLFAYDTYIARRGGGVQSQQSALSMTKTSVVGSTLESGETFTKNVLREGMLGESREDGLDTEIRT
eukprot:Colp12_sorted_trinity150504_noHs@12428